MNWNYGIQQPDIFTKYTILGQQIATINCFISKVDDKYKWKSYTLPPSILDYDSIVNIIISAEYSNDKMQAIVNNYLFDKEDPIIKEEFNTMQEFRKRAKEEVKAILAYVEANNLWQS